MSYNSSEDPTILKLVNGGYTRAEIVKLETIVRVKLKKDDQDEWALALLAAIQTMYVPPLEQEYVFLGFCPGGLLERRLDEDWIKNGVCTFEFIQNESIFKRFCNIRPGDTIILKKREAFGSTMRLFSHGKVKATRISKIHKPYLLVDWITPSEFLEVPLMGCNTSVDVRSIERVDSVMPEEFWAWLGIEKTTSLV